MGLLLRQWRREVQTRSDRFFAGSLSSRKFGRYLVLEIEGARKVTKKEKKGGAEVEREGRGEEDKGEGEDS